MAKDPYRYFRVEARELLDGLTQGILVLEKGDTAPELIAKLLRLAHTLKGAARVVKQAEVAELAHAMEEILAPQRETGGLPREQVNRLLALVDTCGERLKPVLAPPREGEPAPPAKPEEVVTNLRVEVADVDGILYELADASARLANLRERTATLEQVGDVLNQLLAMLPTSAGGQLLDVDTVRTRVLEARTALKEKCRALHLSAERTQQDFDRVRDRVGDLRLLPARELFPVLERTARDAAEAVNKRVMFEAAGGEQRLDAHILLALRDALIQIVRNAVAHGIESEAERDRAGKVRAGQLRLQVFKRGGRIHFVVEDDGRGLDLQAIRRAVIARRLATPAEADGLGMREAAQLLFQGGFSTAPAVSEVMGRGVGLDVVRATVARLKGDIELRSEPGSGTAVEIAVPVSLESLDILTVAASDWTGFIPFDAVRHTLRIKDADLIHSAPGTALLWNEEAVPFRLLAELLGCTQAAGAGEWTAVIVRARGGAAALGVDRLEGVRHAIVRPLPPLCGPVPLVAGATLDAAGDPQLVLDPAALVEAVRTKTGRATPPASSRPLPILVVDDSLTTRMLEQSILETAGYEVELAVSGEEALEKARTSRYALFVVDVEMPGINGFELLERFRADPLTQQTPAILVTSRVSPEDLRRGERAGARAHISKSDFDSGHLLRIIRKLAGEAAS